MKLPRVSLAALMGAQAQVTFNDSAAKLMLIALAQYPGVVGHTDVGLIRGYLVALLVAPVLMFSPVAGWGIDRFPKARVLNFALGLQCGALLLLLAALWCESWWGAAGGFLLLAVQTALFAPAKRAVLRELVGPAELSRAVGTMEALSIGMILVGALAGGQWFGLWTRAGGEPWQGTRIAVSVLAVLSILSWAAFQLVEKTPAQSVEPFRLDLLWRHNRGVAELWRDRPLRRATFGIMFFYGMGTYLGLLVIRMAAEVPGAGGTGWASAAGILLLFAGAGAALGDLAAGVISRRGVELGLAPLGGALLVVAWFGLGWIGRISPWLDAELVGAGFASGFFLVPLCSFVQETAGGHRRGRILAAVGLLAGGAALAAAGLFLLLSPGQTPGWEPATQFFALAALSLFMLAFALRHLPHQTVSTVMGAIGPLFYRVKTLGAGRVPDGGVLLLCNHLSYVDAVVLQVASLRPVRFVVFAGFERSPTVRFLLRAAGAIPASANKPLKGIRLAIEALRRGEVVCIFPEGAISRTGQLMELKRSFEAVAREARVPVVPVAIDGLWGSVFSFAGNKYLWKSPRLMPTPVCVAFGDAIPWSQADAGRVRKAMLDAGESAFQERPVLRRHLAREVVRSLAKRPRRVMIVDRTAERRVVTAGELLAAAAALSRRLRATVPEKRIGIVLPPGAGAHLANLAIACAGKTPVNLNFTIGRTAAETCLRLGEIRTVITADVLRARLPQFPFPAHTLDLKTELAALGGRRAILPWLAAAWLLPNQWVAGLLGLPRTGDQAEAALLFTSGSSGEPKGVILTHRNLLANCAQISSLSILPPSAILIACLPVFHSFGFTVTLWYPLLRGCAVVTLPNPLDTRKIIDAVHGEKATVLIGAPTFIRPFLKKATREELQSLNLVVTGAEKLPQDLYDGFLAQFGIEILQGYGLTETTPATNINQHHPPLTTHAARPQLGKKVGAVGRLMPGMTARIVDPDTGGELALNATGIVWLKGANVFPGYLNDTEKTAAALRDAWFVTGDLGRFDDDGFLFIEGRLSRFSKIGAEMVPHGTVEQRLIEVFGWDQQDGPTAVIVGVPDAAKGEAIVLVTLHEVTVEQVRTKLAEAGLPNLWIPRIVRRIERIPVLGSGKTDLKACRLLVLASRPDPAQSSGAAGGGEGNSFTLN